MLWGWIGGVDVGVSGGRCWAVNAWVGVGVGDASVAAAVAAVVVVVGEPAAPVVVATVLAALSDVSVSAFAAVEAEVQEGATRKPSVVVVCFEVTASASQSSLLPIGASGAAPATGLLFSSTSLPVAGRGEEEEGPLDAPSSASADAAGSCSSTCTSGVTYGTFEVPLGATDEAVGTGRRLLGGRRRLALEEVPVPSVTDDDDDADLETVATTVFSRRLGSFVVAGACCCVSPAEGLPFPEPRPDRRCPPNRLRASIPSASSSPSSSAADEAEAEAPPPEAGGALRDKPLAAPMRFAAVAFS